MPSLGDLVRDEITGFKGVVMARLECLYETTSCKVQPRELREDVGTPKESVWFEDDRLTVLEETAVVGFKDVAGKRLTEAAHE